ncbi:hypothetical protein Scep_010126 [Stephania cephalantha]|uniref:Uncharacterized protein n=1 Tax=Stephania cephalantha TaxID=152367 RepID=A0AAP0JWP6_9MAGN
MQIMGCGASCDACADVPRPKSRRNLRSKTRWFTDSRNSHQVSHFATFFIDARAEISVAESRSSIRKCNTMKWTTTSTCHFYSNLDSLAHVAPDFVAQQQGPNGHSSLMLQCQWFTVVLQASTMILPQFTYGNLVTTSPSSK